MTWGKGAAASTATLANFGNCLDAAPFCPSRTHKGCRTVCMLFRRAESRDINRVTPGLQKRDDKNIILSSILRSQIGFQKSTKKRRHYSSCFKTRSLPQKFLPSTCPRRKYVMSQIHSDWKWNRD